MSTRNRGQFTRASRPRLELPKSVGLRLPTALMAQVEALAGAEGRTYSGMLRALVEEALIGRQVAQARGYRKLMEAVRSSDERLQEERLFRGEPLSSTLPNVYPMGGFPLELVSEAVTRDE